MFTTPRLRLRPMTITDANAIYQYRSIPEVNTYTYTPVWTTMEEATNHVLKLSAKMEEDDSGFCKWMIELRDSGQIIGDVFLGKHDELQGTYEIGYMLHPDFYGHGYATEAVREVLRIGFEEWNVHRIYARVDEENIGSARVCQKLGMRQEARLIESDRRGNVWSTELNFAMLNREWKQRKGPRQS